jgi:hypothetical protein
LLTSDDRAQMSADLASIRDERPVSIAIRRNGATLAAQTVRIARGGNIQAGTTDADGLQAAVGAVIVVGDVALDIQPGDKFTTRTSDDPQNGQGSSSLIKHLPSAARRGLRRAAGTARRCASRGNGSLPR